MLRLRVRRKRKHHSFYARNTVETTFVGKAAMQPNFRFDPRTALKRTAYETAALGLRLVGYLAILALLVAGAVMLCEQLPDAVAQARGVAVSAGWTIDPPPLRGSL